MIIKRPLYNQQLKCVAFEILSSKSTPHTEENKNVLHELLSKADSQLPIFLPFAARDELDQIESPIENPIILKLDAQDIETMYPLQELQDLPFSLALLINTPQQLTFLNYADYIGLSEQLLGSADVTKVVQYTKSKQRKVIAYGIAQPLNFDKCKAMVMDFYCGDFLYMPTEDDGKDIAANKLNLLRLIQSVQKKDCDFQEVSNIIQSDPLLSFQMLKVANSVGFSGYNAVDSIDQAISRLGIIHLKNWITVLSMKNISNKPKEIMESGLIRAHMAESIAKLSSTISPEVAYTTGLLSVLDCLLNKPMPDLLNQITLAEEIKDALIGQSTPLGDLLSLVVAYEAGHWEQVPEHKVSELDLSQLYIESLALASQGSAAIN